MDRLSILEQRVGELAETVRQLDRRVASLERRPAPAAPRAVNPGAAPARRPDATAADVTRDVAALSRHLGLAGRTLLVLAGAFLLRAVTDSGALPTWLGVTVGCAYAGAWVALAWRDGPTQPWSAAFHGISAILIGFPLVFEAATRFRLLSPAGASAVLAAFTAGALGVAALRRLPVIAWLVEGAAIVAALALMIATGRLAPPSLYLALVGVAALWLGYVLDWIYLRWPVAFAADLALVVLTLRATAPSTAEGPRTAFLVQVIVLTLYLGSIAARTLLLKRAVVDFEVVQTAVLIAAGLGGAWYLSVHSGTGAAAVGAASTAFGVATYAIAFAFLERREQSKANFYFYGSAALVFVLAGTGLLLTSAAAEAITWAALAVVAAALARALGRFTLGVHACIYGIAAALDGGAISHAAMAIVASPAVAWPAAPAAVLPTVVALAAAAWLTRGDAAMPREQRIPRCLLLGTLALAAAGLLIGWLVPPLAGTPGPMASAGVTATVRTGVLVGGVLLLAWAGRSEGWREAGWLAYPVLAITGVKLVLEDLSRSRPGSLFLAFALYGAALILVPRLRRREASAPAAATAPPPSAAA